MKKLGNPAENFARYVVPLILLAVFTAFPLAGCKSGRHTSDPHFRQIDDTLDAQLPPGTSKSRVTFYLSSQGFPLESTADPRAIVAIVHRVDTETLRPETARVTFHFDARDNLTTYELAAAPGSPSQP